MLFFIGWHQPVNGFSGCQDFDYCMISINRLIKRRSDFWVNNWILDSGAFTRVVGKKGHLSIRKYAKLANRWSICGNLMAVVSQDYMCEPIALNATKLTITDHQRLTILRYDKLLPLVQPYLMPVLQGFAVEDYLSHIDQYGDRLQEGQWVGVGSVCKRNSSPSEVEAILMAIKAKRPDLRLHGFGLKKTALKSGLVRSLLYSADSQAHSFGSTGQSKFANASNPLIAKKYAEEILNSPVQLSLLG